MANINWTELFTGAITGIRVNDTYEPMFGNPGLAFRELVYQYMGSQAAQVFEELIDEASGGKYDGDNWELIADGYFQELLSTADELESLRDELAEILGADRLSRQRLEKLHHSLKTLAHNVRFNT